MTIPAALLYFYLRKERAPFKPLWILFIFFIAFCGLTHIMEFVATWYPVERFTGLIKSITAIISLITVGVLWKIKPFILQMKTPGELEEIVAQRTLELQVKSAELAAALDKAEKLTKLLTDREHELVEQDKQKNNFLAMLAHELRNPLAPVRTVFHIIKERYSHCLDESYTELDEMANRQLAHLSKMIDDLLDVARITHGKIKLEIGKTFVNKAVDGALRVLGSHSLIGKHNIEIDCPENICVLADATRLEQILTNLLQNSIKYTNENGTITVKVKKDGTFAQIGITDTGKGIPEDNIPNIYNLFFQSEQSIERANGGLGIGLTVVKHLIDLHGGKIEVDSKVGIGTTFYLYFPLIEEDGEILQKSSSKKLILIVEDNHDAATSLGIVFRVSGYKVNVVHDGNSAVISANLTVPDVVILDIGLPGLNGFEVAKALRSSTVTREVKIVVVSGYSRESDIALAKEAGVNEYLVKPVDIVKLKQAIEEN